MVGRSGHLSFHLYVKTIHEGHKIVDVALAGLDKDTPENFRDKEYFPDIYDGDWITHHLTETKEECKVDDDGRRVVSPISSS